MPTGWFTDGCLDKELIKEAKSLLSTKMCANTKFLIKHLGISGQNTEAKQNTQNINALKNGFMEIRYFESTLSK